MDIESQSRVSQSQVPGLKPIKTYSLSILQKKVKSSDKRTQFEKKLENKKEIGADPVLFKQYIQRHPAYSPDDEELIDAVIKKLKKEGNGDYTKASKAVIQAWLQHNSPVTSDSDTKKDTKKKDIASQDVILLQRLKTEQAVRLQQMRNDHEDVMQERAHTQKKFYVTTVVSIITSIAAIAEAILLAYLKK
jgi:hypothetical protein